MANCGGCGGGYSVFVLMIEHIRLLRNAYIDQLFVVVLSSLAQHCPNLND